MGGERQLPGLSDVRGAAAVRRRLGHAAASRGPRNSTYAGPTFDDLLIGKQAGVAVRQFLATLHKTLEDAQIGIPTG